MIVLVGTPIGLAVSKLLGFDKFTSETLNQDNFILQQNHRVIDKDIPISLIDFYADSYEVGMHLQAELPKKSVLLKDGLTTPLMSLSLTNTQGEDIFEDAVGKKWSSLDKEKGVLDFFYTLSAEESETDIIKKLDGVIATVYRIGAIYEGQKNDTVTPGFHELKGETIEGEWAIEIDTSKLKRFETLTFEPTQADLRDRYQLLVSPTRIIVEINETERIGERLSHHDTPELIAIKKDTEMKLPFEGLSTSTKENEESIYQLIFDFGGYDSYDKFVLNLPKQEALEFIPK